MFPGDFIPCFPDLGTLIPASLLEDLVNKHVCFSLVSFSLLEILILPGVKKQMEGVAVGSAVLRDANASDSHGVAWIARNSIACQTLMKSEIREAGWQVLAVH